jgi:hypothetical protein
LRGVDRFALSVSKCFILFITFICAKWLLTYFWSTWSLSLLDKAIVWLNLLDDDDALVVSSSSSCVLCTASSTNTNLVLMGWSW